MSEPFDRVPSPKILARDLQIDAATAKKLHAVLKGDDDTIDDVLGPSNVLTYQGGRARTRGLAIQAADKLLDTHGVEEARRGGMYSDEPSSHDFEYLNTGDTYAPTLLFRGRRVWISSWGDEVEALERRGIRFENPPKKKAAKRKAKDLYIGRYGLTTRKPTAKARGKTSTVTTVMTTKTTKTTRRGNPDGRHYGIDEWPEFVLEGVLESAGASTSDTSITPQLKKAIERYESELYDVLMEWTKKVPPMTDEVWVDSTPYDIFATLSGEGVGIWDGRWDHLYNEREIKALINYLQHSKVSKAVDDTGGGWLNDAFEHVAYERGGSQENPGRKKNPTGPGHQIAARLLHGD
jgi:hypothetical protein